MKHGIPNGRKTRLMILAQYDTGTIWLKIEEYSILAGIYLLKVNDRNTKTRDEICSKLTIEIPERRQWRRSGIFIVNFEHFHNLFQCFYC